MPDVTWDANFEISPADTDEWKYGANKIRQLKLAISERGDLEHNWDTGTQPFHKAGKCSVLYSGNTTDIANLTGMSAGSVAWDTTLSVLKRYSGADWVALQIDHGQITGLADDDHTQYQKESDRAAANGYPSLDANSKVVQNPANANATPTANSIPLANANGFIAMGWLSPAANANANGYVVLPGNIYMQWGYVLANENANVVVTFPTAFPANLFNAQVSIYESNNISDRYAPKVIATTLSNMTLRNTSPTNLYFYWMALGK